jgi:hypothetical protein
MGAFAFAEVAGAGEPQAASKPPANTSAKRTETNFFIDMVFILLGMNGVKVGNIMTDLIGIYWKLLVTITPPWICSKNLSRVIIFETLPVALPVALPEMVPSIIWQILFKCNGVRAIAHGFTKVGKRVR